MSTRRSSPRPDLIGSAGYSLVEVVVAMLISCVMVTAVLGVALTSKQGTVKTDHRMMFDQGLADLSSQVKQYVTGCGCDKGTGACPVPSCTLIPGPNNSFPANDVRTWNLNGANGGAIVDSLGAVWALSCGHHVITGAVPALEGSYSGTISYDVTWPPPNPCLGPPADGDVPQIRFIANWTEK